MGFFNRSNNLSASVEIINNTETELDSFQDNSTLVPKQGVTFSICDDTSEINQETEQKSDKVTSSPNGSDKVTSSPSGSDKVTTLLPQEDQKCIVPPNGDNQEDVTMEENKEKTKPLCDCEECNCKELRETCEKILVYYDHFINYIKMKRTGSIINRTIVASIVYSQFKTIDLESLTTILVSYYFGETLFPIFTSSFALRMFFIYNNII